MRTGRPKTKESTEKVTLRMPSADVQALRDLASFDEVTIAHLIRRAVKRLIREGPLATDMIDGVQAPVMSWAARPPNTLFGGLPLLTPPGWTTTAVTPAEAPPTHESDAEQKRKIEERLLKSLKPAASKVDKE